MNKHIIGFFLIVNTICQISFGQTKTYNGSFNTKNFQGNATYNYLDDVDKRIFNGPFQFKNSVNSVSINGQFKDDYKTGQWFFKYTNVANTDVFMKNLITLDVVGNYQNGNLEGQWKLNRTKTISFNNNEISEYYKSQVNALSYLFEGEPVDFNKKTIVKEKSTANFNNNHFSGNFSYIINEGSSVVKGIFDSNGYYDSIWTIKYYDQNVLKIEYHHFIRGVLTMIKNKDNSTGDVSTIYDKTVEVMEFFQNYDELENVSKIGQKFYKLELGSLSSERNSFLKDAIKIWYNNSDLVNYSCAYEIDRGSTNMTTYPLRIIVEDYEKTREYQQEQIRKQEEIAQKKRKEELEKQRIADEKAIQERRKREEEEKAFREYEASDLGKLKKSIKLKYSVWLEKGDQESDNDYKKRIQENGQTEFDKIVKEEIKFSKDNAYIRKILSASLQPYNEDSLYFEIKLYAEYTTIYPTPFISISIPKNHEVFFSSKFNDRRPGYGYPILAYITETTIINNNWTPSKVIFVFNNAGGSLGGATIWESVKLMERKGKYTLERPGYDYTPIKLSLLNDQLSNKFIESGVYYYEWKLETTPIDSILTIENLEIKMPQF